MRDINAYADTFIEEKFEAYHMKYRLKALSELIGRYPHKKFLEVGCGTSPLGKFIRDYDEYTIVEPADRFMDAAKGLFADDERVTFVNGFFENEYKALTSRKFDFIVLGAMLHEVENPEDLIRAAFTLSSVGTVILTSASNARSFHRLLGLESGIIDDIYGMSPMNIKLQQARMFDMDSLYSMFEKVGKEMGMRTKLIECGSYFIKPFTNAQMEACLTHGVFDEKVLDGLNRMTKYMPELGAEFYIAVTAE